MMPKFGLFCVGLLFIVVAIAIPSCNAAGSVEAVEDIRQNYNDRLNSQLVQRVHGYSKSVLFYKAYASYFDRADVDLPGFKKYFQSLSAERIETAHNLTTIINERGGFVSFQNVKLQRTCLLLSRKLARFPRVCYYVLKQTSSRARANKAKKRKFSKLPRSYREEMTNMPRRNITPTMPTALSALEDALALERATNTDLISLMDATGRFRDPAMRVKLDAFLERQVDVIYNLSNHVTRLNFYKNSDQYALGEYILDSDLTYF